MTPRHQEVAQLQQGEKNIQLSLISLFPSSSEIVGTTALESASDNSTSVCPLPEAVPKEKESGDQRRLSSWNCAAVSNTRTSSLLLYTSLRRLLRRTRMTETIRAGSKRCRSRWRCRTLAFCRRVIALCRRGCRSRKCHRRRSWHCLQYRQIARRPRNQNSMNS